MANLPARDGGSVRDRLQNSSSSNKQDSNESNEDPFSGGRTGSEIIRDAGQEETAEKTSKGGRGGGSSDSDSGGSGGEDTDPFSGGRTGSEIVRDAGGEDAASKTSDPQSGAPERNIVDPNNIDDPELQERIQRQRQSIQKEYRGLDSEDYQFVLQDGQVRPELTPSGQEAFQTTAELDTVASRIDEEFPNATGFDVEQVFDDAYRAEIETSSGTVTREFAFDEEAAEELQKRKRSRRGFSGVNPQTAEAISQDIASSESRATSGSFINTNPQGRGVSRGDLSVSDPRFESDGSLAGDIDAFVKNTQARGTARDPYATSTETQLRDRVGDPGAGLRQFGSGAQSMLDERIGDTVDSVQERAAVPFALPLAAAQLATNEKARDRTASSISNEAGAAGGLAGAAAAGVAAPEPISTGGGLLILGGLALGGAIASQTPEIQVPEDDQEFGGEELPVQEGDPQANELPVQEQAPTGEVDVPSDGQFRDQEVQVPEDPSGFGSPGELGISASAVATGGTIGDSPANPVRSPFQDFQSMIEESQEQSVGDVETIERPNVQRDYLAREIDGLAGTVTAGELGNAGADSFGESAAEPSVEADVTPSVESEVGAGSSVGDVPLAGVGSQVSSPANVDSPPNVLSGLGVGVGSFPGLVSSTTPGFGPETAPSTTPINANPEEFEFPNEVVNETSYPNAYPNEYGFSFGNETARPRFDTEGTDSIGGGFDFNFGGGSDDDFLAAGWGRETIATIATFGTGTDRTPSQSALEDAEGEFPVGELPTGADLFGDERTQENIDDVEDLFGGLGGFRF